MAELAISTLKPTAASPSKLKRVQVGEAVNEGSFGVKIGAKYYHAKNDTAANAAVSVIFANSAALDGYAFVYESGHTFDIGATTSSGEVYCVASTAGESEPHSEVATTEFVSPVFTGTGTSVITFQPRPSGYAKP